MFKKLYEFDDENVELLDTSSTLMTSVTITAEVYQAAKHLHYLIQTRLLMSGRLKIVKAGE